MSFRRLNARISKLSRLGVATLYDHDLRFHKISHNDGSGKCDILQTNEQAHYVLGVLYQIDPLERHILDGYEGVGLGYEVKPVTVEMHGERLPAFAYYATQIDEALKPLSWYKEHVIRGARENELPADYIKKIEIIASIDDHDTERHRRELSIYF